MLPAVVYRIVIDSPTYATLRLPLVMGIVCWDATLGDMYDCHEGVGR